MLLARAHVGRCHRQKRGPGEAAAGGPVCAHPQRGQTRGREEGTDARAPGPRRRRRHFVSSAQWKRVTAERGREAGEGGMNQALGRGHPAKAGSAGRLSPCHHDFSVQTALSRRTRGGRGTGGSGPGRRHIGVYLVGVPFPDRSRCCPSATARRGLPQKNHAVRTGLLSPTAMARRGGGGAGAGGERAGGRALGRCGAT